MNSQDDNCYFSFDNNIKYKIGSVFYSVTSSQTKRMLLQHGLYFGKFKFCLILFAVIILNCAAQSRDERENNFNYKEQIVFKAENNDEVDEKASYNGLVNDDLNFIKGILNCCVLFSACFLNPNSF